MSGQSRRSLVLRLATVPVALALLTATATAAHAGGGVSVNSGTTSAASFSYGNFAGSWLSSCTMPEGPEGPENGAFYCHNTTKSVGCAAVVNDPDAALLVSAGVCRADLVESTTSGYATANTGWAGGWTCATGGGWGTFLYIPAGSAEVFRFPVSLTVSRGVVTIIGHYTSTGDSNRTIRVYATFPAGCSWETGAPAGYEGVVSPV